MDYKCQHNRSQVPPEEQIFKMEGKEENPSPETCWMQVEDKTTGYKEESIVGICHTGNERVQLREVTVIQNHYFSTDESPTDRNVTTIRDTGNQVSDERKEAPSTLAEGDDLGRLRNLLEVFEQLSIESKPKLYEKLGEEQKECCMSFFQECLGDKFFTTIDETSSRDPLFAEIEDEVVYCKNLLLKDRKGQFYLVIMEESCTADLKQLKQQLNASRNLSFASQDDLKSVLGLNPGEVTPFSIMQTSAHHVRVVLHETLSDVQESNETRLAFHPFCPSLQVEILFSELLSFMAHQGKELEILGQNKIAAASVQQTLNLNDSLKNSNGGESNEDKNDNDNDKVPEKQGKKNKLPHFERKGRLSSYLKKKARRAGQALASGDQHDASEVDTSTGKGQDESNPTQVDNEIHDPKQATNSDIVNLNLKANGTQKSVDLNRITPTKTIPEIEEFYNVLTKQNIVYSEISVSTATSKTIGPALGVRCFMLKDKRQNYYVVVSHEFYELDYGRLKKSLKPRKKLDVCNSRDLPFILGADCLHFTPFAVMNSRARHNNVQVFLTEKIVPKNIVFCIQHPFAQGRRILMKSSELQRLLTTFVPTECFGVVEEKAWPKKYNTPFSQFDHSEDRITPTILNTERKSGITNPLVLPNPPEITQPMTSKAGLKEKEETREIVDESNRSLHENGDISGHVQSSNQTISISSYFYNFVSSVFDATFRNFRFLLSNDFENLYEHVTDKDGDVGSLVDDERLYNERNVTNNNKNTRPLGVDDAERMICDHNKKENSVRLQGYSSDYSDNPGHAHVSIDAIKQQLDLHRIKYVIKRDNNKVIDEDENDNDDGDDNDDDERTSQVCFTLHMLDDSEDNHHYIVVGMDREHVSVKRFRRRFQIQERLFIVNDENVERLDGDYNVVSIARAYANTNPFSVFLSTERPDVGDPRHERVEYEMILYSSVYMDPEMLCIFELDHDGMRLCITSEELETYAKRVGMDVWYMP